MFSEETGNHPSMSTQEKALMANEDRPEEAPKKRTPAETIRQIAKDFLALYQMDKQGIYIFLLIFIKNCILKFPIRYQLYKIFFFEFQLIIILNDSKQN